MSTIYTCDYLLIQVGKCSRTPAIKHRSDAGLSISTQRSQLLEHPPLSELATAISKQCAREDPPHVCTRVLYDGITVGILGALGEVVHDPMVRRAGCEVRELTSAGALPIRPIISCRHPAESVSSHTGAPLIGSAVIIDTS